MVYFYPISDGFAASNDLLLDKSLMFAIIALIRSATALGRVTLG